VGVRSARKLINHFGSAREVFALGTRDLLQVQGMGLPRAHAIKGFNEFDSVERELNFAEKNGLHVLSFQDENYPKRLTHCFDAPVVLFKKGGADLNAMRMVSVVGTRNITDYGRQVTRDLIKSFVPYNITVVSGLARGIDVEAHSACLEYNLPTIAVLGHGLDRIYPAGNKREARRIAKDGALLSEFFTETLPDRENFPKRNRIVAGMTDATIVIESGFTGGSIITADLANSYNRDVFAVPGGIYNERSSGCNRLIKTNRAALLESVNDLAPIMGWKASDEKKHIQRKIFVELSTEEEKLISLLNEKGKQQIDDISLVTQIPMSTVMVHLLNLEMNGLIRALPGKVYELA